MGLRLQHNTPHTLMLCTHRLSGGAVLLSHSSKSRYSCSSPLWDRATLTLLHTYTAVDRQVMDERTFLHISLKTADMLIWHDSTNTVVETLTRGHKKVRLLITDQFNHYIWRPECTLIIHLTWCLMFGSDWRYYFDMITECFIGLL